VKQYSFFLLRHEVDGSRVRRCCVEEYDVLTAFGRGPTVHVRCRSDRVYLGQVPDNGTSVTSLHNRNHRRWKYDVIDGWPGRPEPRLYRHPCNGVKLEIIVVEARSIVRTVKCLP